MKNRCVMLLSVAALSLIATGCMETKKEEKTVNSVNNTQKETTSFEENLNSIDWNTEYLNVELTDRFKINGTVMSSQVYSNKFGLYEYTIVESDDEITFEEEVKLSEEIAKDIDEYYGKEVSYVNREEKDPKRISNVVNRSDRWGYIEPTYTDMSWLADVANTFMPYWSDDYDKEKMDGVLAGFKEKFEKYAGFKLDNYKCIYTGGKFYEDLTRVKEYFEDEKAVMTVDDWPVKNYYQVEYYKSMDNGTWIQDLDNIAWDVLDNEVENPKLCYGINVGRVNAMGSLKLGITLNADMEIKCFWGDKMLKVEDEPFEMIEVKQLSEIITNVYNKYKNNDVLIADAKMVYYVYAESELNSENMREAYIAPYWLITYRLGKAECFYQLIYSAIDGKLVFSVI